MTQAVGYITGRSELLYGAFFLAVAARRAAVDAQRRLVAIGRRWRSGCCRSWPRKRRRCCRVVLWCYDAWLMDGDRRARLAPRSRASTRRCSPWCCCLRRAAWPCSPRSSIPQDAGPDWRYVLVAVDAFWQYLALFVWPKGQTIMHTDPDPCTALTLARRRRRGGPGRRSAPWSGVCGASRRSSASGLVVTAAMLLPSSVLFITGIGEPMAEHRAYISAMGFFLAVRRGGRHGLGAGRAVRPRHAGARRRWRGVRRAARRPDAGAQRGVGEPGQPGQGGRGAVARPLGAAPAAGRNAAPELAGAPKPCQSIAMVIAMGGPGEPSRTRSCSDVCSRPARCPRPKKCCTSCARSSRAPLEPRRGQWSTRP